MYKNKIEQEYDGSIHLAAEFNSQTQSQNHKKCCNQFCLFLCICFCVKWWLLLRKERKCVNFDEWHQVGKQKSFICKKADPFYILDLKYNLKVETILSFSILVKNKGLKWM